MLVFTAIIGFLGPFGTYLDADFAHRTIHWGLQLMGAYLLVRPSLFLWQAIANATALPRQALLFWGVALSAVPLALLWSLSSDVFFNGLNGFFRILPFAILCALAVLVVAIWADRNDTILRDKREGVEQNLSREGTLKEDVRASPEPLGAAFPAVQVEASKGANGPRLARRLSPHFKGPIIALQSEDHYVRVHGHEDSELLFMRLRDAISEMDEVRGEQIHRSWWVAADAIVSIETNGRRSVAKLVNKSEAPVARDSVSRIKRRLSC